MNAAETIEAAIDKLTSLRNRSSASDPAPWWVMERWNGRANVVTGREDDYGGSKELVFAGQYAESPAAWHESSAELTVTLHATIDAQLAILRDGLRFPSEDHGTDKPSLYVKLARAILGEQVDA